MPPKGEQTRETILKAAAPLFVAKGFSGVTMSDLCEATGLSRGGLYRHFGSVAAVFQALLEADKQSWAQEMESAMEKGISAQCMLSFYLEQTRLSIERGEGRLSLAVYEYLRSPEADPAFTRDRFQAAVDMYRRMLEYGQKRGEFGAFDAMAAAQRGVVFIDGLRLASANGLLDSETIARHLQNLLVEVRIWKG
ncbi:MAG: TetR/AcrR family transcriptional regulator [Eubacteriales bacterium]|nr:TetR/AcrR family transcriptional regulator [Eubacteriales bacterium]